MAAGNDVTSPLVVMFPKKEQPKYTTHDLQVSDAFLQKVINELDPNGTGDPVTRFVKINSEMRRANNQTLSDLRFKTADQFPMVAAFHAGSRTRRRNRTLPMCAITSITARRSISRFIWDTTWR